MVLLPLRVVARHQLVGPASLDDHRPAVVEAGANDVPGLLLPLDQVRTAGFGPDDAQRKAQGLVQLRHATHVHCGDQVFIQ